MNSCSYIRLIAITFLFTCCTQGAWAQSRDADRIKRELDKNRGQISGQRVSRQAEISRLEQMIERLQARVTRLERQSMGSRYFPAISVLEAKAMLAFAETKLEESERLFKKGFATERQVTSDRLAVVRAQAQLKVAQAAQADQKISAELAVSYAEGRLAEVTLKQEQLKRLVAKGFATSAGLEVRKFEVAQAQQELHRARSRLKFQQKLIDGKEEKTTNTDE